MHVAAPCDIQVALKIRFLLFCLVSFCHLIVLRVGYVDR
jgi:hypothetical protein